MMNPPIRDTSDRPGICLVLIGAKDDGAARWHNAAEEFFDLFPGRLWIGAPKPGLEDLPFHALRGPHRATAPKLRIVESVDEVRRTDQEIDVHGPILAVLEALKAIEDQWLDRCLLRTTLLV